MSFSNLNVGCGLQSFSQTFQSQLNSLALHRHSPRVLTGVMLILNGLFFLMVRYIVNELDAYLNRKFPSWQTTHLVISSALLGGAVGTLNFALFKHARLPVTHLTFYAIGICSVALHLIFKLSPPSTLPLRPPSPERLPTTRSPEFETSSVSENLPRAAPSLSSLLRTSSTSVSAARTPQPLPRAAFSRSSLAKTTQAVISETPPKPIPGVSSPPSQLELELEQIAHVATPPEAPQKVEESIEISVIELIKTVEEEKIELKKLHKDLKNLNEKLNRAYKKHDGSLARTISQKILEKEEEIKESAREEKRIDSDLYVLRVFCGAIGAIRPYLISEESRKMLGTREDDNQPLGPQHVSYWDCEVWDEDTNISELFHQIKDEQGIRKLFIGKDGECYNEQGTCIGRI